MTFDDSPTNGKSHAGAFVLAALAVKPLEWSKDFVGKCLIEADAVVFNAKFTNWTAVRLYTIHPDQGMSVHR